jgi:hypothetical protein
MSPTLLIQKSKFKIQNWFFPLANYSQRKIRDNIKYKYGYLKKCYTGIMNRVKAFFRDPVPLAVHAIHPVMRKYQE